MNSAFRFIRGIGIKSRFSYRVLPKPERQGLPVIRRLARAHFAPVKQTYEYRDNGARQNPPALAHIRILPETNRHPSTFRRSFIDISAIIRILPAFSLADDIPL